MQWFTVVDAPVEKSPRRRRRAIRLKWFEEVYDDISIRSAFRQKAPAEQ